MAMSYFEYVLEIFLYWAVRFAIGGACQSKEALHKAIAKDRETRELKPPSKLYEQFSITETTTKDGHFIFQLTPKGAKPGATLLYLHGGAFMFEMSTLHWRLVATLAQRLQCTVVVPIYPLAPETDIDGIYEVVQPIYEQLAAAATPELPLWCVGDSCGGTMALAFSQQALAENRPVASRMVLISPCTDYSLANPDLHVAAKSDPWLTVCGIEEMTRLAYPGRDPRNPTLSPIYGELAGLPPMLVFAGSWDLLTPDTKKMVQKAKDKGVTVELVIGERMVHIWPVLPHIPKSTAAVNRIVSYLSESRDS